MYTNVLTGVITIGIGGLKGNIFAILLGIWWLISPCIMWFISRKVEKKPAIEKLNQEEKDYLLEIGKKNMGIFQTIFK